MYDIANLFDGNVNITRLDAHLNPTTLPYCNFMCLHGCVKLQIFSSELASAEKLQTSLDFFPDRFFNAAQAMVPTLILVLGFARDATARA